MNALLMRFTEPRPVLITPLACNLHPEFSHVSGIAHSQAVTQGNAATGTRRRTAAVLAAAEADAAIEAALEGRCSPKRPRRRK